MASNPRTFFDLAQQRKIVETIRTAETRTSGEIRLYIEGACSVDPLDRARQVFVELGMTDTELRNGVLLYLAVADRKMAVVGDVGVHEHFGDETWSDLLRALEGRFGDGAFLDGVVEAIDGVGRRLARAFPHQVDDLNELSDAIAFGS